MRPSIKKMTVLVEKRLSGHTLINTAFQDSSFLSTPGCTEARMLNISTSSVGKDVPMDEFVKLQTSL